MKKHIFGFTLLELLVVIGIIGIMMALATVAYSTTQQGARNARRKQDLVAIQNALEQYYSVNGLKYPVGECSAASTYLKSKWPTDPDTGVAYEGAGGCTETAYCICGALEPTGNTDGNSDNACLFTGGAYYCVGNLQ